MKKDVKILFFIFTILDKIHKKSSAYYLQELSFVLLLHPQSQTRVSLIRLAPVEFPQGLTAARVDGCSSAMWVAYPPCRCSSAG